MFADSFSTKSSQFRTERVIWDAAAVDAIHFSARTDFQILPVALPVVVVLLPFP